MTKIEGVKVPLDSCAEVKALVSELVFKRAKEIATSGKLHNVSFQGPSLQQASASCKGSNLGDNYSLSLFLDSESTSNITCQCSCPAAPKAKGNLCKHVVALLLLRLEEVENLAKNQADGAMLSECKLPEDHLVKARRVESALSDSEATEDFVPSDDKVDNDICTTASSVSPVREKNQKRILPSWFSEGCSVAVNKVRGQKMPGKSDSKKNESAWGEQEASSVDGGYAISKTVHGIEKSKLSNEAEKKRSFSKKRKNAEPRGVQSAAFENDRTDDEPHKKPISNTARRSTRKQTAFLNRQSSSPAQKRRRGRDYVESDLSEDDQAEVLNNHELYSEGKEDLSLTTEDLVNLATEHLEMETINDEQGNNQLDSRAFNDELPKNAEAARKRKGSIFSVQGWNEIANEGPDVKGVSGSQKGSEFARAYADDLSKYHSLDHATIDTNSPPISVDPANGVDTLRTADNVVDDMLGLIFGPTLSKTVNSRLDTSQSVVQDVDHSTMICPEVVESDVVLPVFNDSALQPKKKSSLKDKVMMYLGQDIL